MFFKFKNRNKTIKELRKNCNLTTHELAFKLKIDTTEIIKIDKLKLKEVPEPLKSKLLPIFRNDHTDNIPW